MNRDFKGVWIPRDIWLNKELTLIDKVMLTEIDSLDNEDHCYATNEYFAEFFGVGVATITRSIKKLRDLGYIECEMRKNDTGSYRLIKMIIRGSNQNDETPLIKMINNYNNMNNTKSYIVSKDTISTEACATTFEFGKSSETKKPNLYQKCINMIDEFTNNLAIRTLLIQYLDLCMEMKSIRGGNQWKGMLNTLERVHNECAPHTFEEIIQMSIDHGWKTFYPIKDVNFKPKSVTANIEKISKNDYDKYDRTISEREF